MILMSCSSKQKEIDQAIEQLGTLQCKAVTMKEERFALFEQIRTLESDTVNNIRTIDSLKGYAESLKSESLVIADSLNNALSRTFETIVTTDKDKAYFNTKMNALVEKCKSKGG